MGIICRDPVFSLLPEARYTVEDLATEYYSAGRPAIMSCHAMPCITALKPYLVEQDMSESTVLYQADRALKLDIV